MHLRASNVSIYFPMNSLPHDEDAAPMTFNKLGGDVELYKGRPHVRALNNVSLDLHEGDRLGIIGHNGSGKSTLLRVLGGIYFPQEGSVECNYSISGIFNMSLGFRLDATGYRNIVLKGLIAGKTYAEIQKALPEIAELTELGPYLDMPLRTYSQGMAMRLAFAITTAFSSEILLMDEWISAGDAHFNEKIIGRMNSFVDSAQIVVLTSHSTFLLRRIATKVLWMESGRVRAIGPAAELIEEYSQESKLPSAPQPRKLKRAKFANRAVLLVSPSEVLDYDPKVGGSVGEINWDASSGGYESVDIVLINPDGDESTYSSGAPVGKKVTRSWLRPGLQIRMIDTDNGDVIASVTIGGGADWKATRAKRPDKVKLSVSPTEIVDYDPKQGGVAGEIAWDASIAGYESVDIVLVGVNGEESTFSSVSVAGKKATRAWLRPGMTIRMIETDSGDELATRTIGGNVAATSMPAGKNPDRVTLSVDPAEIADFNPKQGGVAGQITWDAAAAGYESVDIVLVKPNGDQSTFSSGSPAGSNATRAWLRPGIEIRMIDPDTNGILASRTIIGTEAAPKPVQPKTPERVVLRVSPSEIPDYDPKQGGVIGEIAWDAAIGGYEEVDILLISATGNQTRFSSGPPVGIRATKAWLRPGLEIRMVDAETGSVLASTTISQ